MRNPASPGLGISPADRPTLAYITAGAAGMYCGSCMRDNTLAAALARLGCDIHLIPTYTPIRTDEENVAIDQVFFGGINVFLQEKAAFFRHVPKFLDRWLDRPWLIEWLAGRGIETDATALGALTVSMLQGERGHQKKEVERLVGWLAHSLKPRLVNLSNILIAGCVPAIKAALGVPVLVTLQGDDLFLADLPEPFKKQAFAEIRRLAESVDGFIVFSRYYADFMAEYLGLDRHKFHIIPLGLNLAEYPTLPPEPGGEDHPPTIGYFARVCPAKGLHLLIEALIELRRRPATENVRVRAAGWLGPGDRDYFDRQLQRLARSGVPVGPSAAFHYAGALDRREKLEFLRGLDLFTVPTTYRDPKGIFALEAMASGMPVVLPDHGAFPELIEATAGGVLFPPNDAMALADQIHALLTDRERRRRLARDGHASVHRFFSARAMAERTLAVYQTYLPPETGAAGGVIPAAAPAGAAP